MTEPGKGSASKPKLMHAGGSDPGRRSFSPDREKLKQLHAMLEEVALPDDTRLQAAHQMNQV